MTYTPSAQNKKAAILTVLFAVAAVAMFLTAGVVTKYRFAYQITGIVSAIIGVELYLKYVMANYVYEAADDSLRVFRITGTKRECVCSLAYSESLMEIIPQSAVLQSPKAFPKTKLATNVCKNLYPERAFLYYFRFNGKNAVLKFEPDDAFVAYTNRKIADALQKNEDENDE